MKRVERFPRAIRELETCWIPLSDGSRLAARIWLPEDAEERPVPAVVESIPYRRRDRTRRRDEVMHRWFAGHGLAAVRIDARGTGDSDGLLVDEYHEQELLDGVEALRWIAARHWCTGSVGMLGKSWGGINALQIAALAPPELRAIVTVCSSDDRYADDAHYMGGCLLGENLTWGSVLLTMNALPPDPDVVGAGWRDAWLARLRAAPLFPARWLAHQRRDAYWRHGSVCEDYGRIRCPVFAVGGWADAYTNAVPRLLAGLGVPRTGLVGPWAHLYPHQGVPGPAVGFLQEVLGWFGRWLGGVDGGAVPDVLLRAWMPSSRRPAAPEDGRWVAERSWPPADRAPRVLGLRPGTLVEADAPPGDPAASVDVASPQTVGLEAGAWCPFGMEGEGPGDQRPDDAGSLVFDSAPLAADLEILGAPRLVLAVSVDRPQALVAVRLCELGPDGSSTRVTYGLANLCHREGPERPVALEPGRRYELDLQLNDVAHAFPAGSRLRLALSTAYWPIAWPSPEPVTLTVLPAACRLELPARPPRADDAALSPLPEAEGAVPDPITTVTPAAPVRERTVDPATGEVVLRLAVDAAADGGPALERLEAIDLLHGHSMHQELRIHPGDPLSARATVRHHAVLERGEWSGAVETEVRFSSTRTTFRIEAELRAHEGGALVLERTWDETVPRDHM